MSINETPWTIEHFEYLDRLRISGATNMYGAGQYLVDNFGLEYVAARLVLMAWMETFDDSPAQERIAKATANTKSGVQ